MSQLFPAEIVGVIASYLPPTTRAQRPLMLVHSVWFSGVMSQNGAQLTPSVTKWRPMPYVSWPWCAIQQRQPKGLRLQGSNTDIATNDDIFQLVREYPQVRSVQLEGCDQVDDSGLMMLSQLSQLECLALRECNKITDAGLLETITSTSLNGGSLQKSLKKITLEIPCAETIMLQSLGCLENLTDLEVHWGRPSRELLREFSVFAAPKSISVEDVVSKWTSLERLRLTGSRGSHVLSTDTMMKVSSELPHLQDLRIVGMQVSDQGAAYLGNLKRKDRLKVLHLDGAPAISPATIKLLLQELPFVENWSLAHCRVPSSVFTDKIQLSHLTSINLVGCDDFDDIALSHLVTSVPNIEQLALGWSRGLTDAGFASFESSAPLKLRRLSLTYIGDDVTDAAMAHFGHLLNLEDLRLSRCHGVCGGASLTHIFALPKFRVFDVSDCHSFGGDGFCLPTSGPFLRRSSLCELRVSGCAITDDQVQYIASSFGDLSSLTLAYSRVTDTGLEYLGSRPHLSKKLRSLSFEASRLITDTGLRHLHELKNLRQLKLEGCTQITKVGLQDVASALDLEAHGPLWSWSCLGA